MNEPGTTEDNAPDPTLPLDGIHVLLVEDFDDAREMLAFLFEMCGADVVAAASARQALAALESRSFHILVSDIGLPGATGYDLVRQIRRHEATQGGFLPAIAVTAFTSEADRAEAYAAGFQQHIPKPVAVDELVSIMSSLASAT